MNKDKEYVVHALLNSLNMLAKDHDVHISSNEDMYLKVDGEVVGLMYYDATEKMYVVRDVAEQEVGNLIAFFQAVGEIAHIIQIRNGRSDADKEYRRF